MTTATTTVGELDFDPYDASTMRDPHELFRRLRDERPLYYNPAQDFYALTRYDDVEHALLARDTFISGRGVTLGLLKMDVEIPPGTVVLEANRDEREFDDPDRFDVTRPIRPHQAFGFGAHYCLGQALARLEARIALEETLKRFPRLQVDDDRAEFLLHDAENRGWKTLPLVTS